MKNEIETILFSTGALLVIGAVMMSSITVTHPTPHVFYAHLFHIGVGLVALAIVSTVDYRRLAEWHLPRLLIAVAFVMLVLVLIPGIGTQKNSARRWLLFFQPSEFAKLAFVIWLADYCAKNERYMHLRRVGFTKPMLIGAPAVVLVFAEPDWGTAVLLACVLGAMLWVAGAPTFYLLSAALIGTGLVAHFLLGNPEKLNRILVFLNPWKYADDDGWQIVHSVLSIGSGGLFGKFIGGGIHKYGFVPEQRTDFIMSAVGEELGFVGCTFVVISFVSIVIAGLRIALTMADTFARMLSFGITFLIGGQALINIAVATSCLPNKGIPLPFVSYGGSNLLVMLAATGLLINVGRSGPFIPVPGRLRKQTIPLDEPVPMFNWRGSIREQKEFILYILRWTVRKMGLSPSRPAPIRPLRPWQRPPMAVYHRS